MSADVLHLTRGDASASYENLISILRQQVIEARSPCGAGRRACPDVLSQRAVCFTEVPVHQARRIFQRRIPEWWNTNAWNGIAFSKTFIAARGGGPILYAYDGTPHALAVEAMVAAATERGTASLLDPIWKLTPFVEIAGKKQTNWWEWEREWRHVGDLKFEMKDVSFLIVPEEYHQEAKDHFLRNFHRKQGPIYFGPLIDANWPYERSIEILRKVRRPSPALPL